MIGMPGIKEWLDNEAKWLKDAAYELYREIIIAVIVTGLVALVAYWLFAGHQ